MQDIPELFIFCRALAPWGAQIAQSYDPAGRPLRLADRPDKANGATIDFLWVYDALRNRKRLNELQGPWPRRFVYDAFGRLAHIGIPFGPYTDLYQDGPDTALMHSGVRSDQPTWTRFVHGPGDDQVLAMEVYAPNADPTPGTGQQFYFHADAEGSIRLVTDSTGNVANRYDYDSFGRRIAATESVQQPYGWKGRDFLAGPDIYYNRARFYDPVLGKFIAEDPLGFASGDTNLYAFAWSNPRNWNDPSGLSATGTAATSAAATGAAPAIAQVGYNVASLFTQATLAVAEYTNVRGTSDCGATGTPPAKPAPVGGQCPVRPQTPCGLQFSFEAGTLIQTKDGPKGIEDIKIGDLVASRDTFDGETTFRPVTDLFRRTAPGIVRLTLQAQDGSSETSGVTGEHPYFKEGKGWTPVRELAVGDMVLAEGGAKLRVARIDIGDRPTAVYNLEVAQDHSYFVGKLKAWVHNEVFRCTRPLKKIGVLPHTFLCVPINPRNACGMPGAMTCRGYGPDGWEAEPKFDPRQCQSVATSPCMDRCVYSELHRDNGKYNAFINNCEQIARDILTRCSAYCPTNLD